jgi:hypothetical protein
MKCREPTKNEIELTQPNRLMESEHPEPAAADKAAPAAVLYIANIRSARNQFVYGQSGHKYVFKHSKELGKLVREYASKEVFQREELDIRRNTRNPLHVCTMLGALDPVEAAQEAVVALIGERQRVAGHVRLAALTRIAELIGPAIAELGGISRSSDPEWSSTTVQDPSPEASKDSELPESSPTQVERTEPQKLWTEAELMQLSMFNLKLLAEELQVPQLWKLRTRSAIAGGILLKQQTGRE